MGRFLFVTWAGGGNVPPVLALAASLGERGHEVTVLGPWSLAGEARAEGAAFIARDRHLEWDAAVQAGEVIEAVAAARADVAVVDYMLPGALCGARVTPAATVALVHTLYGANLEGTDLGPMAMAASVGSINDVRTSLGLEPVGALGALLDEADRVIVTSPRELDVAAAPKANVRYVGPALLPAGPDATWRPPGTSAEGPLVVVGLGTTPMDEGPVLQRVLDALEAEAVRVVATVGPHLPPTTVAVPPNAIVHELVRHAAVLPHASAVVTHAGLGTVLAALSHGLPLVCVPLGREQPANAAAVERVGAGVVVDPDAPADVIGDAVRTVLVTPSYAAAAGRLAEVIAGLRAGAVAERSLEELLV